MLTDWTNTTIPPPTQCNARSDLLVIKHTRHREEREQTRARKEGGRKRETEKERNRKRDGEEKRERRSES